MFFAPWKNQKHSWLEPLVLERKTIRDIYLLGRVFRPADIQKFTFISPHFSSLLEFPPKGKVKFGRKHWVHFTFQCLLWLFYVGVSRILKSRRWTWGWTVSPLSWSLIFIYCSLNIELDIKSLFGFLCTAVLITICHHWHHCHLASPSYRINTGGAGRLKNIQVARRAHQNHTSCPFFPPLVIE